jgi:transposase
MSNRRRKFDKEFKQKSVDVVIRDGLPQTKVSRRLGLGDGIIGKWVTAEKTHATNAFFGKGKLKPEDEEMKRPRETRPRSAVRDRFSKKNPNYFASLKKWDLHWLMNSADQFPLRIMCKAMRVFWKRVS